STPSIVNWAIPDGKIIADNTVSSPVTSFDVSHNIWITKVPVGFGSTSDIFITGAIINSSTGFVKSNGNTSSDLNGIFYSNKDYSDQWAYAIAAYQPQFDYSSIAGPGQVLSVKGNYSSGTPTTQIQNLVSGGSGGGGNNYSGSTSSYDNFSACKVPGSSGVTSRVNVSELSENIMKDVPDLGEILITPNPASDYINLSFVPVKTGNSKIVLYSIDGRKLFETDNGIIEKGKRYLKKIEVSKFITGIYLVQLWNEDNIISKKIIISR
ncbi:MAG: T9SS type A sorting domain-containing protein, partial [Bacteroidia bacterium]|nr:T9SS type A sorting domain-containing protein [Bacteroidia bacterium]